MFLSLSCVFDFDFACENASVSKFGRCVHHNNSIISDSNNNQYLCNKPTAAATTTVVIVTVNNNKSHTIGNVQQASHTKQVRFFVCF